MKAPINILHLEDDPKDAALIHDMLSEGGIPCATTRVETRSDFVAALERGGVDLVLSDCALPAFDGISALRIAHAGWPDVPLIFVSGTLGEERAIDSLKSGATDYVLKDNLARLVPAVRRAIQEVAAKAACQKLEVQFIEAQKMEVLGQLAGGVAHDFNNILSVIMGHSEFLIDRLGEKSDAKKDLESIRLAAERAAGLTRQLLIFSRKETVQPIVLDLNDAVADLHKMLRRLVDENISISIEAGQGIGRIKADPGYLGQVLMNLIINARDAMRNGGRLTIATANVTIDDKYAAAHPGAKPGDFVMLSVSDTGCGMSKEVKARLFETFFTTKPKGKGTGLGLATCRSIVNQCGGFIEVWSEEGKGSSFKVNFPRIEQPVDAAAETSSDPLPRGEETVLLVEDDPSVRRMTSSVLESQGYTVICASNGQEGLRAARDSRDKPIRLVITDVIMPQMSGKVMADWLKATYPNLRILFTSGYTDDSIEHHGVLEMGVELLPKPYTPATLTRKIRDMLDAGNAHLN